MPRSESQRRYGREYQREWRKRNPDKARESWRKSENKNREARNAEMRARRKRNPEHARKAEAGWRARNPQKWQLNTRKKNARRRNAAYDPYAQWYLWEIRNDPCPYCSNFNNRMCVDHIVPLTAGGTSCWQNLTMACRPCNASKYNKSLLKYLSDRAAQ